MVGALLSTCSHARIIISIGCLPSGRLSISGLRLMRIWRRRISRTWVASQVSRPMNLSASPRISPSAGWCSVWRWRSKSAERRVSIISRCYEGGDCIKWQKKGERLLSLLLLYHFCLGLGINAAHFVYAVSRGWSVWCALYARLDVITCKGVMITLWHRSDRKKCCDKCTYQCRLYQ